MPSEAAAKKRMQERMAAWHRGYSASVTPVKAKLGKVIAAFRGQQGIDTQSLCTELKDGAVEVLGTEGILQPPDPKSAKHLASAYKRIHLIATACLEGRDGTVRAELEKVALDLGTAAKLLSRYGLKP